MMQLAQAQNNRIAAWLALLLFGIYLLTYSGRIFSGDGMSMFSVAESIVKRGEFNTDQLWTLFKSRDEIAMDGESYAKYGYGTSLLAVPLYALAMVLPGVGLVQTALLTSAVAIALAGAIVFLSARRLNFSPSVSIAVALLFGIATPAWVYAREFWSEPFGLVTLSASLYFLICYRDQAHSRDALIAGIALALAVATRVTNAALVPLFAWYSFSQAMNDPRARRGLVIFALPLVVAVLLTGWYDWARFGSPFATGYRADETFDNPVLLGLYGLLFSPGKGLFVYMPFLAALPFSFALLFRRAKRESILIFVVFAFYVLLFSAWYYWWGGTSWGPRFLVPTLPFLVLAVAPAVELALQTGKNMAARVYATLFFALVALSVAIEMLGVSLPALAYRLQMVRLSANPEMDAVFLPSFSPLVGSLNLLKPSALNFAWLRVVDRNISIDVLILVLTVAFVAFSGLALWALFAKQSPGRLREMACSLGALLVVTTIAIALSLFSLFRYADDFRFGGNDGYRALLQVVGREEQPQDVLVLNDDVFTPFFLNEDRARLRWYGLSRDPKQWDDATRALMVRLSQQHSRVWLAYDDSNANLPDPVHDWLDQSLGQVDQRDFSDGVHLALYATGARP